MNNKFKIEVGTVFYCRVHETFGVITEIKGPHNNMIADMRPKFLSPQFINEKYIKNYCDVYPNTKLSKLLYL